MFGVPSLSLRRPRGTVVMLLAGGLMVASPGGVALAAPTPVPIQDAGTKGLPKGLSASCKSALKYAQTSRTSALDTGGLGRAGVYFRALDTGDFATFLGLTGLDSMAHSSFLADRATFETDAAACRAGRKGHKPSKACADTLGAAEVIVTDSEQAYGTIFTADDALNRMDDPGYRAADQAFQNLIPKGNADIALFDTNAALCLSGKGSPARK